MYNHATLALFSGSDHLAYAVFEIAAMKPRWTFMITLAVTFDWGRKMFEKAKAIREATKARIRNEGREEGLAHVRALLDKHDISLPQEVIDEMFGGKRRDQS